MRYFLELAYNGTAYNGWQIQSNAPSVQQTLQEALSTLRHHPTEVVGAGRTDTGVHASYYVAHMDLPEPLHDPADFLYHLNALLPHDIAVEGLRPVRETAHARFDAQSRSYRYHIAPCKDPFRRDTAWQLHWPLQLEPMNRAAEILLQTEDFTSFCKLHSDNKTNLCHVTRAAWVEEGELLVFHITADRFLRNMVRAIVGTLVDIGRGKLSVEGFREVIEGRNRALAGSSVPPQGLFLCGITYPPTLYLDQ
ncbi:MAG: tRNA pseudouridine(38-40) synthase TruA [Alistipes sp.]|nr:tRNA pseudouridine(38-40) synthase TruA [Alistipes sp.]